MLWPDGPVCGSDACMYARSFKSAAGQWWQCRLVVLVCLLQLIHVVSKILSVTAENKKLQSSWISA